MAWKRQDTCMSSWKEIESNDIRQKYDTCARERNSAIKCGDWEDNAGIELNLVDEENQVRHEEYENF